MSIDARLAELNLELPPAPPRGGVYQPVVVTGNLAYISGHGPYQSDGTYITGRLGDDLDVDAGYAAAKQTGLALLATMKAHLGKSHSKQSNTHKNTRIEQKRSSRTRLRIAYTRKQERIIGKIDKTREYRSIK